jgi:tight adherence protein C
MSIDGFSLLFGLAVAGIVVTILVGLRNRMQAETLEEERLYFASMAPTLEDVELERPFRERVINPAVASLLALLGRLSPQRNIEDLQHKLEVAGRPYGWTVADFLGVRVLSGLVSAGLVFVLMLFGDLEVLQRLLLVVLVGALGYYLPVMWLGWRINGRKREILRAMPDGLDMLNICVGAGLGFDAALSRIGERWQTALADEFNRVVIEIRLGKTRSQALLDLAARTEVPEVENFVATIVQADQLGVSIAKVLRTQAEQMRIIRRQRAEEQARQATIKLLFPLVFLIFPSMLIVLLGPAVPQLIETLGGLTGG